MHESDEPDVELYGGGRKGVKRYPSLLCVLFPVYVSGSVIISSVNLPHLTFEPH